jgi:hypothetical protein
MNHSLYYIEEDFSNLAGPYNMEDEKENAWMQNVINDLNASSIEFRIVHKKNGAWIERKGMILSNKDND